LPMAMAKQQSIRLTAEDSAVIDEIQRRTGLIGVTDAVRYALRQFALREGIDLKPKPVAKKKR
jgi:hypothetical protein